MPDDALLQQMNPVIASVFPIAQSSGEIAQFKGNAEILRVSECAPIKAVFVNSIKSFLKKSL